MMSLAAWGQNTTNLDRVTIFTAGAQVQRHKQVMLQRGEQTVSFTGLSPYIDAQSLQVGMRGRGTIVGVSHRYIRPDSTVMTAKMRAANDRLRQATRALEEVIARQDALKAQIDMVKTNSSTAARTVATPLEAIKQLNQYYYDETVAIKKRLIALDDEQMRATQLVAKRQQTVDSLAGIKLKRLTVIDVKVDAPQASQATFTFSYYVAGASWYPSYDLRATNTSAPLELTYKANISQQTNEDWRNASVTLSTASPNRSNVAPALKTYWLDYGLEPPTYDFGIDRNTVTGTVVDEAGEPMIGATVKVKGTTIATLTDVDGHYSITLPNGNRTVEVSFIGCETQEKKATGSTLDFAMEPDRNALQEVVVMGYGASTQSKDAKYTAPVVKRDSEVKATEIVDDHSPAVLSTAAKFGYEFAIDRPLTLPNDNKPVVAQIGKYSLPATYAYSAVPKIDRAAFLVADATGWEALNLTQGEATVYYDNSYVGRTLLDPTQLSDTLHLSLGRVEGIHIARKLVDRATSRRLLGSNVVETMQWEISLRNARAERVSLEVNDQIPVSRNSDITVTTQELSGGRLDKATGEVVWTVDLAPGETRKLTLTYQVKHAKNRKLNLE